MMQVEAVPKMLQPDFNVCGIAAKRRNKSNPWFKRGTLFRSAVDVLRKAGSPDGAGDCRCSGGRQGPQANRKQAMDLHAAILAALRGRNGAMVVSNGAPAQKRPPIEAALLVPGALAAVALKHTDGFFSLRVVDRPDQSQLVITRTAASE
jgi:hypothetical protein